MHLRLSICAGVRLRWSSLLWFASRNVSFCRLNRSQFTCLGKRLPLFFFFQLFTSLPPEISPNRVLIPKTLNSTCPESYEV
jgi:hypothetical protein